MFGGLAAADGAVSISAKQDAASAARQSSGFTSQLPSKVASSEWDRVSTESFHFSIAPEGERIGPSRRKTMEMGKLARIDTQEPTAVDPVGPPCSEVRPFQKVEDEPIQVPWSSHSL